eukprot:4985562-Amphidinium_carterae.1
MARSPRQSLSCTSTSPMKMTRWSLQDKPPRLHPQRETARNQSSPPSQMTHVTNKTASIKQTPTEQMS